MKTVEIELRFEILNPQSIEPVCNTLTFQSEKRIIDCYLDTSLVDLLKKGIYIRVRDSKKIDIKFNRACLNDPTLELQSSCEEYSFTLPLQPEAINACNQILESLSLHPFTSNFDTFLQHNNLKNSRIVDKIRKSYIKEGFTIVIDKVAGLGFFLEIELMALPSESIEEVTQQMKEIISSLNVLELKPLKTGYDSLILRKNNFEQYLQGRFILEEDKHLLPALKKFHVNPSLNRATK
ncbi:CYTH domain-containing protein [Candidatus Dependentiae bacterium]|nr:CYTH domain-containing protein [Candidatus Dependentiae bacterium]